MRPSPARYPALVPLLLLALGVGFASAAGATEPYPTDRCVAAKLQAAGRYCRATVGANGQRSLEGPRRALWNAWQEAEAVSAEAGVSCQETTVDADAMIALLDAGADGLRDALGNGRSARREARILAGACSDLLRAEGKHLLRRDLDRSGERLERQRLRAITRLEKRWDAGRNGTRPPLDALEELVSQALLAAVVSPAVPTDWTAFDPPDQVAYGDQVLEPICSRGTPWVYFARRGTVNKLIVYYQGGGACWNSLTCGPVFPVFKQTVDPIGENPGNGGSGFADFDNPANPFKDWNAVVVPYCTGDVHWGDAIVDYGSAVIRHKGRVNAAVAEKFAREHFVKPEQVFVTGSSAGSYGAIMNGLYLQEFAYPSTPFAVLGDAGNGVITREFLEDDLAGWGIEKNLPRWIPALDVPITQLEASDLWTEAARFYPRSRWANYTTAYDGSRGGQVGFYNIMLSGDDVPKWLEWWTPTCEWNAEMRRLVQDSADRARENYRYYIGVGSRHTMWGSNKVYTDTTGGVPLIVDWLNAMLLGTSDWTNVECRDCGTLLPGDPRPNPVQPPYVQDPATGEQRIVCP